MGGGVCQQDIFALITPKYNTNQEQSFTNELIIVVVSVIKSIKKNAKKISLFISGTVCACDHTLRHICGSMII